MGAETRCHAQLLIRRDTEEKKSEAGVSVTETVWQGSRDMGLIGSRGREALRCHCAGGEEVRVRL